jgi:cytoskeletal protein CcmA (bactofilin family)
MSITKKIKHIIESRLKGGALYYAIFVMLFLSLLSVMLLSFFEYRFKEDALFSKQSELNDNLNSAITFLSCNPEDSPPVSEQDIDLFDDGSAIVSVESSRWGLLRKIKVESRWKTIVRKRIVLMAEKEKHLPALWMPDRKRYVSLVGKSYISGTCYLSELGLRRGNAEGRNFEGPYLHKGEIYKSESLLPLLNKEVIQYFHEYFSGKRTANDSVLSPTLLSRNREIIHPFSVKSLLFRSHDRIVLEHGRFEGNIIFSSSDTIEIWPTVQLKNVLLLANTIIVKAGFKGQLQAFASKKIEVEENCEFSYPSLIGTIGVNDQVSVTIGEDCRVNGGLICFQSHQQEPPPLLTIGKNSLINGKVYVNGDISFSGAIHGGLLCERFIMRTPRAFYENFILDSYIDSSMLPAEYASFSVTGEPYKLREAVICN